MSKRVEPVQEPLSREITDLPLPKEAPGGFARYQAFEPFAEGGGGILQKAVDAYLGRSVVFKSLRPELLENPDVKRRFMREARVTALLQHPATVPIYELGRNDRGEPYFTMKELRGETLQKILSGVQAKDRKFDDLASREALMDILIQVGQALAYAHASGVIHRDVKPANILVGAFGEVMVMDWGVAKILDENEDDDSETILSLGADETAHGKVYGTPRYMAPEQARGKEDIDERVDIFSLGAVLYEALVHSPLVFGNSRDELLRKICDEPFVRPSRKQPLRFIPPELDAIVMKALAKDPEERYADMKTFVDDMQKFRRGEVVSLMETSRMAKVQRWAKKHLPLKRSALLVGFGLLLGWAIWGR